MPLEVDLDRVRAVLGIGFDEGAAWFSLDEKETPFAPQKSPGHRALLLRKWSWGPVAWVVARSRTSNAGLQHSPHDHKADFPACWLNSRALIVTDWCFTVQRKLLNSDSYMCAEPDASISAAVLVCPCP